MFIYMGYTRHILAPILPKMEGEVEYGIHKPQQLIKQK